MELMQGGNIFSSSFIQSAKVGVKDDLRLEGILDALAWGNYPPIGASGQLEIIYPLKIMLSGW
ncbi:hypothetical protein AAHE18_16G162500 [Arachis hypogaea]